MSGRAGNLGRCDPISFQETMLVMKIMRMHDVDEHKVSPAYSWSFFVGDFSLGHSRGLGA